jgi:hypothetical protein
MFLDPRIPQQAYQNKLEMHVKTQTNTSGDTLNRFKQCFNLLSGKEVDAHLYESIGKFKSFLSDYNKLLLRLKSLVERSMANKVELDNAKVKLLAALGNMEQMIAHESKQMAYRSQ